MKGLATHLIVAMIVIILSILIVFIFIQHARTTGETIPSLKDFYYHCSFWSANHYSGHGYGDVDMEQYCRVAIGKQTDELTSDDWDDCRNACRSVNITTT